MRVLVCGGRDFGKGLDEYDFLSDTLTDRLLPFDSPNKHAKVTIIHGAARGADEAAGNWAYDYGMSVEEYPADWNKHGKAAGYIRNKQMLEEGKPDLVIAFPGGKGTANMIKLARDAGVPVEEVKYDNGT